MDGTSGETVTNPVAGMTLLFVKTADDTDGELAEDGGDL